MKLPYLFILVLYNHCWDVEKRRYRDSYALPIPEESPLHTEQHKPLWTASGRGHVPSTDSTTGAERSASNITRKQHNLPCRQTHDVVNPHSWHRWWLTVNGMPEIFTNYFTRGRLRSV